MTDDQKRALGLGGIGIVGFLFFRRMQNQPRQVAGPQTSGAGGSVAPYTPQAPLPLEPGQSVYDPNSEGLLNTPAALLGGPQATTPSAPAYTVNVNYPKPVAPPPKPKAKKPTKRPVKHPAKKPPKKAAHR